MTVPIKPLRWDPKDPDETLNYGIKWAKRLAASPGDTILTSVWTLPAVHEDGTLSTISGFGDTKNSTMTNIWLSGGVEGEVAYFLNEVTTAFGAVMNETVRLEIRSK